MEYYTLQIILIKHKIMDLNAAKKIINATGIITKDWCKKVNLFELKLFFYFDECKPVKGR